MLDEEDLLSCEDISEEWFQEASKNEDWTARVASLGEINRLKYREAVLPASQPSLAGSCCLEPGGEHNTANGLSGPAPIREWRQAG